MTISISSSSPSFKILCQEHPWYLQPAAGASATGSLPAHPAASAKNGQMGSRPVNNKLRINPKLYVTLVCTTCRTRFSFHQHLPHSAQPYMKSSKGS
ncbi:hypothetical protein HPP92_013098 [Vanilla planifolia]|uniref:Uncharacterized protein n=1 Tax=Vanilla planifolia TaxID=51239 RepID=A0A835QY21_VANPL|nr:hypothetical protein HPP92_013098 [Vanilla planifolia]